MSTRILISSENFFYTLRVHLNCLKKDFSSPSLKNVPILAFSNNRDNFYEPIKILLQKIEIVLQAKPANKRP
jgi:hypothetical protein